MDLAIRWQRLLRALAFIGGCAFTALSLVFVFSNVSATDVHWRIPTSKGFLVDWNTSGVSIWLIAAVPLLIGAVAGYVYHLPARMHHLREHMRHRQRVHELEHEVRELRTSLDRILMMPEDGRLAVPAMVLPPAKPAVIQIEAAPAESGGAELVAITDGDSGRKPTRPAARVKPKPAAPRGGLIGGLKAELASIKMPEASSAGNRRPQRTTTIKSTAESAG